MSFLVRFFTISFSYIFTNFGVASCKDTGPEKARHMGAKLFKESLLYRLIFLFIFFIFYFFFFFGFITLPDNGVG